MKNMKFSIEKLLVDIIGSGSLKRNGGTMIKCTIINGGFVDDDYNQIVFEAVGNVLSVVITNEVYSLCLYDETIKDPVIWEENIKQHGMVVDKVLDVLDSFITD